MTPNARGTRPTILLLPPLPLRPPPQQLVARRCRVVGLPNWLLNRLPLTAAPPSSCLPSHSMASPSRIAALVRALKKRGNCSEQPWAVKELADLVVESLDSRSAAVEAGAIPVLLRLLQADAQVAEEVVEYAVMTLGNIVVASMEARAAAIADGAAPLLVQLLTERRSGWLAAMAAGALRNLTSDGTAMEVLQAGAAPALVAALAISSSGDASSDSEISIAVRYHALDALYNLACTTEAHPRLLAVGVLPAAAHFLASCSPRLQMGAANLLSRLSTSDAGAEAATAAGVAQRLVQLVSPSSPPEVETAGAGALVNLVHVQAGADAAVASGGLPALVGLLRCSLDQQQMQTADRAIIALNNLATRKHLATLAAAGSLPAFVSVLSQPCSSRSQVAAAEMLHRLAFEHPQLMDASTAAEATAGLIRLASRCQVQCPEDRQKERSFISAVLGLWGSNAENRSAIGAALARLQRSSDGRVQSSAQLAASLINLEIARHS